MGQGPVVGNVIHRCTVPIGEGIVNAVEAHGMNAQDPGVALWTAAIGLAVFICGFGSAGHRNDDFRMSCLIGLAGAVLFIAGIAALSLIALHDV